MCEHSDEYEKIHTIIPSHWANIDDKENMFCPQCGTQLEEIEENPDNVYRCRSDGSCGGHDQGYCPCCDRTYTGSAHGHCEANP